MGRLDRPIAAALVALMALPPGFAWCEEPAPAPAPDGDVHADVDALAASIPPERYDVAARAATLAAGVDAAFAFVRDEIGFEAYPGVLRGARVTLASEAGNAFDRALLLAALLREKGVETRFALGTLSSADASRLGDRIFAPVSRPASTAPPGDAGGPATDGFVSRVRTRAARDYAAVREALGTSFPRATPAVPVGELTSHAWVQAKVGDAWVDLDPSFPDASPGKAFAKVDGTPDELPPEVHQTITVRVITETLAGGSSSTATHLEVTAPAVDLVDALVVVGHAPEGGDLASGVGAGIAAAGSESWKPFLWVDGEARAGSPIAYDESGTEPARGGPPSRGLGGAFGPGGALGSKRDLVAEWLEVEIAVPGRAAETTRKILLDRGSGSSDPKSLRPMPRSGKDATTPRRLHVLWFTAGRHDLASFADAYRSLLGPRPGGGPEADFVDGLWPVAVQTASIAIVSDHVLLPSLEDLPSCRFYADSPRLLVFSAGPGVGPEGTTFFSVDLPRDAIRGVARSAADAPDAAARKCWFGCLQGALEHEFCAIYASDPDGPPVEVESTSSLRGDEPLTRIGPGSAFPDFAVGAVATELRAAQRRGASVLASTPGLRARTIAFWEVGADGTTRTFLDADLKSARGGGRIPGVVPGNNSNLPTLPSDWASRARNRGAAPNPGAGEPTAPGGRANPSGAPRGGGSAGAPRSSGGPLSGRGGGGGGGGGGRGGRGGGRGARSRVSGTEWLLIVTMGTAIVIAAARTFLPQLWQRGTERVANSVKEFLREGITGDAQRRRGREGGRNR